MKNDHQNEKTAKTKTHRSSPHFSLEHDYNAHQWYIMMDSEHEYGWIATFRHKEHADIFLARIKELLENNV